MNYILTLFWPYYLFKLSSSSLMCQYMSFSSLLIRSWWPGSPFGYDSRVQQHPNGMPRQFTHSWMWASQLLRLLCWRRWGKWDEHQPLRVHIHFQYNMLTLLGHCWCIFRLISPDHRLITSTSGQESTVPPVTLMLASIIMVYKLLSKLPCKVASNVSLRCFL